MPDVALRAGELLLRPPAKVDVPAITAACADPDIARFLPRVPSPYTEADARNWLAFSARGWRGEGEEKPFAIVCDGELVGVVALRPATGGLGYWLSRCARGRGVMARAVTAVIEWGRDEHGLGAFWLLAHPDNRGSQRVAEKLGFRRVGVVRHDPAFRDGTTRAVRYELVL